MPSPNDILNASEEYSWYFTLSIFILGVIGNTINLCVFTRLKLFRGNQSVFYLIIESIVDICQLTVLLLIYLLSMCLGYDPTTTSLIWCKFKNILPQFFRLISTSMVCLAAFDQYLSTNPRLFLRQLSSLSLAHRLTIGAIVLWMCHSIPYAIFFRISPPSGCLNSSPNLIRYYSFFYYPILHGFLPILISCIFSLLAYQNVRNLIRRQIPVVRRRLDRQLTAMIFVRVIVFVILLLPYTTYRIYALNVTISRANLQAYAIDRLIFSVMTSISNLNYAVRGETFRPYPSIAIVRCF